MRNNPYGMTSPCETCPFRTDIGGYLRRERVREIEHSLDRAEFPCHKTVDYDGDDGDGRETSRTMHCAGALILLEKIGRPSQMMRVAERLGMYDASAMNMDAPVFDSFDEMISAQKPRKRQKASR